MASEQPGESPERDAVESMIDDLICDILSSAGQSTKARTHGGNAAAALIETAIAAASRTTSKSSPFERLIVAQVLAGALADALAPALAEVLAPEIMKTLEQQISGGGSGETTLTSAPAKRGVGGRRKT